MPKGDPRPQPNQASGPLVDWLRAACADYALEPVAVYRKRGDHSWPLTATDEDDLLAKLEAGGHFLPLPQEPASLANVVEVSLGDFLVERLCRIPDAHARRGTERGYPDVEISGARFGGGFHALDIKVARCSASGKQTQSRITLYTGNTYFRHPKLLWPGAFRPFDDDSSHLALIAIYTLNRESLSRIDDLELIVSESWRVASRRRSSTTREYIGAVKGIDDLRAGRGEFASEEEFLTYWRKYRFKVGQAVQQQLDKLQDQTRHPRSS